MQIRWTPEAAANLEAIHAYLTEHIPSVAEETVANLYESILSLQQFPYRGRPGWLPGTREFVIAHLPYIVLYQVTEETIEILYIDHGAQEPRSQKP